MKKKNQFAMKFAIVALTSGLFSPSFNVDATENRMDSYSVTLPKIEITLFNQAEAAPVHRQARRVSRRTSRRTTRRVSHRNNAYGGRYYGGGSYNNSRRTGAAVATGVVVGATVATAANNSRRY